MTAPDTRHPTPSTGPRILIVDVKVVAVDDTWSGLKLVRRVQNRSKK